MIHANTPPAIVTPAPATTQLPVILNLDGIPGGVVLACKSGVDSINGNYIKKPSLVVFIAIKCKGEPQAKNLVIK